MIIYISAFVGKNVYERITIVLVFHFSGHCSILTVRLPDTPVNHKQTWMKEWMRRRIFEKLNVLIVTRVHC